MESQPWYVLRSKPRKENSLLKYARSEGYKTYYPTLPAHPVNPRASKVKPYFPGYLFLQTDLAEVGESTFRWMPFSQGLVRIGGEPARLAGEVVQAIRARVEQIWQRGGQPFESRFQAGDQVQVTEGPFEGYRGIFDENLPGKARARVLLQMIHDRHLPVDLPESDLDHWKH